MKSHASNIVPALAFAFLTIGGCSQQPLHAHEDDPAVSHKIHDAAITARIKTAYLFSPHLNSFRINVDTNDGAVTLRGVVKSPIQKDLAGEIAKNADGALSVRNELRVSDGVVEGPEEVERTFSQAVVDATTTASVKLALAFTRGVRASDITVSTRWGTVKLAGTVATREEKRLAEQAARDTEGVKAVANQIEVRG